MSDAWAVRFRTLLEGAAPAVLTTYRKDGSALTSPVWFRFHDGAFEVIVAEDDVKLRHLERRRECSLVVFEAVPPFRAVRVRGAPELIHCDVTPVRLSIAGKYLGIEGAHRFAAARNRNAAIVRLAAAQASVWDLAADVPATH
jgi:hypothetical protein